MYCELQRQKRFKKREKKTKTTSFDCPSLFSMFQKVIEKTVEVFPFWHHFRTGNIDSCKLTSNRWCTYPYPKNSRMIVNRINSTNKKKLTRDGHFDWIFFKKELLFRIFATQNNLFSNRNWAYDLDRSNIRQFDYHINATVYAVVNTLCRKKSFHQMVEEKSIKHFQWLQFFKLVRAKEHRVHFR